MFFRSSWEANYARVLNLLVKRGEILSWSFEENSFAFPYTNNGVRSYVPDFKVVFPDGSHQWHEVKGWMDAKSKIKFFMMSQFYPDEKVVVIDKHWFKMAIGLGVRDLIAEWETTS